MQVWEFGIPVQIKYIADPAMHAISAVSVTPNKKWWCGQSMDNKSEGVWAVGGPLSSCEGESNACMEVVPVCGGAETSVLVLDLPTLPVVCRPLVDILINFQNAPSTLTVVTYSATDRVKPNTKKTFAGHNVAGKCRGHILAGHCHALC